MGRTDRQMAVVSRGGLGETQELWVQGRRWDSGVVSPHPAHVPVGEAQPEDVIDEEPQRPHGTQQHHIADVELDGAYVISGEEHRVLHVLGHHLHGRLSHEALPWGCCPPILGSVSKAGGLRGPNSRLVQTEASGVLSDRAHLRVLPNPPWGCFRGAG